MPRAYYNEIDPFAAAWLRELVSQNLIAPGDVDERSIEDVIPADIMGYTQCHFFAGIGVWSHALRRAGWPDSRPVWTGSCPCQPFSAAGKGQGFADQRHLWPAFHWLIAQCCPDTVFGEQVAGKDGLRWLDLVSTDLETMGYGCGAIPFPAAGIGAPHVRERLYWVAHTDNAGPQRHGQSVDFDVSQGWKDAKRHTAKGDLVAPYRDWLPERGADGNIRMVCPDIRRPPYGATGRMERLRGIGNALNAHQAQAFIEAYRGVTEAAA